MKTELKTDAMIIEQKRQRREFELNWDNNLREIIEAQIEFISSYKSNFSSHFLC